MADIISEMTESLRKPITERIKAEFTTLVHRTASDMVTKHFFPDNGKRNLLLADDYTVDGIYRSLDKKKYDVPIKVLALAT